LAAVELQTGDRNCWCSCGHGPLPLHAQHRVESASKRGAVMLSYMLHAEVTELSAMLMLSAYFGVCIACMSSCRWGFRVVAG
jgi:hypothetical protein